MTCILFDPVILGPSNGEHFYKCAPKQCRILTTQKKTSSNASMSHSRRRLMRGSETRFSLPGESSGGRGLTLQTQSGFPGRGGGSWGVLIPGAPPRKQNAPAFSVLFVNDSGYKISSGAKPIFSPGCIYLVSPGALRAPTHPAPLLGEGSTIKSQKERKSWARAL